MSGVIDALFQDDSVSWDKLVVKKGINDLRSITEEEEYRKMIHKYMKVVLVLGWSDIQNGTDGIVVANKLCSYIPKFKELDVEVNICQLPPTPAEKSTDIECFNMKLEGLDGIKIITTEEFDKVPADDMIDQKGCLKPCVFTITAASLVSQVAVPEMRVKEKYTPKVTHDDSDTPDLSDDESKLYLRPGRVL